MRRLSRALLRGAGYRLCDALLRDSELLWGSSLHHCTTPHLQLGLHRVQWYSAGFGVVLGGVPSAFDTTGEFPAQGSTLGRDCGLQGQVAGCRVDPAGWLRGVLLVAECCWGSTQRVGPHSPAPSASASSATLPTQHFPFTNPAKTTLSIHQPCKRQQFAWKAILSGNATCMNSATLKRPTVDSGEFSNPAKRTLCIQQPCQESPSA